ncbi:MAG: hypothetical protein CVV64_03340 [Candidatus Wallbacteria bacterium HGW-Wallbacteria-1]|uniref:Concentrative nucleoside transporter C-terminal domain-containing protein n=1 Tax=Candidatus Wallbacteria bacterium HGW-Wallbacteria-1 TaxID=2013854 RepID=A0A2N1PTZ4_9BACT|nr:MAG: hypothetical protein CVV64_03340 [Candidatus Wallbacteria bacterium HGW-Wallbacteria-1]
MLLAFIALIYMFNAALLFAADTVNIYAFGRDPYHPVMDVKSFGGKTISPGDTIVLNADKNKGIENAVSAVVAKASTDFRTTFTDNIPELEEGLTFRVSGPDGREIGMGSEFTVHGLNTASVIIPSYGDLALPEGSSISFLLKDNPALSGKDVILSVKTSETTATLALGEGIYIPSATGLSYEVRDAAGAVKFAGSKMKCTGGVKVNMEVLLGWLFAPFAFVMGVPLKDCNIIGMLLGEKIVLNEFFAYSHLGRLLTDPTISLSPRSIVIATYALCGFANFQSIAIQIGGIGGIAPNRRHDLARLGLKSMIAGSIAAFMTATIAGILV